MTFSALDYLLDDLTFQTKDIFPHGFTSLQGKPKRAPGMASKVRFETQQTKAANYANLIQTSK
jgi:hypothetical protein